MPATAGRVRMPANNRVHSSAALQTHGIWQSAIGYDPYAPNKDDSTTSAVNKVASSEPEAENAYANFQGLLALARITGSNADEARGACNKCGRVGHLTFQCRNFLSVKDDDRENDSQAAAQAVVMSWSGLDKLKGVAGKVNGKNDAESEEDEEESESLDSDADSEIERIIAKRYGRKVSGKGHSDSSSKKKKKGDSDDSDGDSDVKDRKKRGRSDKRRSRWRKCDSRSDSEEGDEGRKNRSRDQGRRRRYESSDNEEEEEGHRRRRRRDRREKRRTSRIESDDSESDVSGDAGLKQNHRRAKVSTSSDSEAAPSVKTCAVRRSKQSRKNKRKRCHEHDESS